MSTVEPENATVEPKNVTVESENPYIVPTPSADVHKNIYGVDNFSEILRICKEELEKTQKDILLLNNYRCDSETMLKRSHSNTPFDVVDLLEKSNKPHFTDKIFDSCSTVDQYEKRAKSQNTFENIFKNTSENTSENNRFTMFPYFAKEMRSLKTWKELDDFYTKRISQISELIAKYSGDKYVTIGDKKIPICSFSEQEKALSILEDYEENRKRLDLLKIYYEQNKLYDEQNKLTIEAKKSEISKLIDKINDDREYYDRCVEYLSNDDVDDNDDDDDDDDESAIDDNDNDSDTDYDSDSDSDTDTDTDIADEDHDDLYVDDDDDVDDHMLSVAEHGRFEKAMRIRSAIRRLRNLRLNINFEEIDPSNIHRDYTDPQSEMKRLSELHTHYEQIRQHMIAVKKETSVRLWNSMKPSFDRAPCHLCGEVIRGEFSFNEIIDDNTRQMEPFDDETCPFCLNAVHAYIYISSIHQIRFDTTEDEIRRMYFLCAKL